jgi:hypothetical protein
MHVVGASHQPLSKVLKVTVCSSMKHTGLGSGLTKRLFRPLEAQIEALKASLPAK